MWIPEWEARVFSVAWGSFGCSLFSLKDLARSIAMGEGQLRVALSRLVRRGWLVRVDRGKYLPKPFDRIVASEELYFKAENAVKLAEVKCPIYLHGSAADLLASRASDVDLLVVSENGAELERKLQGFHLAFVTPRYLRNPNLHTHLILKRGIPLTSKAEVVERAYDPEPLLREAIKSYETATVNDKSYGPQLLDAIGLAAKYILYKNRLLPPTSGIGAVFELSKVDGRYLAAFRKFEAGHLHGLWEMVIEWARRNP